MALFDKIFKRANPEVPLQIHNAPEVEKAVTANNSTFNMGWTSISPGMSPTFDWQGRRVRCDGFEKNPVVSACVRAITDIISAVRLELYKENQAGDQKVIYSHVLIDLLKNPIARMSGQQLIAITAQHILTYGNAYWFLQRSGGRISQIIIIYPERLQMIYCDPMTGEPKQYAWTDRTGTTHKADANDIVHFKDLPSNDSVVGFPKAASAMAEILTDNKASEWMNQFFENNGIPGSIISVKNATRQDLKAAKLEWINEYVNNGKRGSPAFVNGDDVKVETLAFNAQQLEAPAMRKIARESICSVFGVDPRMVGIGSAANDGGLSGQQYSDARFRLIQQTIIPLMNLICDAINDVITPEYGMVYIRFSPDALADISEDSDTTSKRILSEWQGGVRGLRESRKALKLPDELDSDDILISQIVKPGRPKLPVGNTGDTAIVGGDTTAEDNGTAALNGSPKAEPAALPPATEPL